MPEELFLILHKVRGQPAFDIAQRLAIGDEEWWIIPTSGHRAYPFQYWSVEDLAVVSETNLLLAEVVGILPSSWPDHYSANVTPRPSLREVLNLFRPTALKKRAL